MSVAQAIQGRDALFETGPMALSCGRELHRRVARLPVFGGASTPDRSTGCSTPASTAPWPEGHRLGVGPILDPNAVCVAARSQFGNGGLQQPQHQAPWACAEQGWVISMPDNVAALAHAADSGGVREAWSAVALDSTLRRGARKQVLTQLGGPGPERWSGSDASAATGPHHAPQRPVLSGLAARPSPPIPDLVEVALPRASPEQGLRTFALIYASWAASQPSTGRARAKRIRWLRQLEAITWSAGWLPTLTAATIPTILWRMLDTWLGQYS